MRSSNHKLVLVSGIFNLLHPGHFRLLQFARSRGDKLLVVLQSTPTTHGPPTIDENERLGNLKSISYVDEAIILDGSLLDLIKERKPDIIVKGWEYADKENPETVLLQEYGGKLIFCPDQSTTNAFSNLLNASDTSFGPIKLSTGYMGRRDLTNEKILKAIKNFAKIRVCVIGDLIVDEYINCSAVGMSQEDPTLVVKPESSAVFLGGAGIVARHARELGAQVTFVSVAGDDEMRSYCVDKFLKSDLACETFGDDTRRTTKKIRYRVSGKTMLRVNDFSAHGISKDLQIAVLKKFEKVCKETDLLILSDFNYGVLPQELVTQLIQLATDNDVIIVADSQTSSQIGNLGKFTGVSLVTPTEYEARLVLNDFESGLVTISNKLRQLLKIKNVVLTLGHDGVLITHSKGIALDDDFENDRLPAFQTAPVDVSGAGDAFMVASALSLATGESVWMASYVGAMASAIQISREGNVPITQNELQSILSQ